MGNVTKLLPAWAKVAASIIILAAIFFLLFHASSNIHRNMVELFLNYSLYPATVVSRHSSVVITRDGWQITGPLPEAMVIWSAIWFAFMVVGVVCALCLLRVVGREIAKAFGLKELWDVERFILTAITIFLLFGSLGLHYYLIYLHRHYTAVGHGLDPRGLYGMFLLFGYIVVIVMFGMVIGVPSAPRTRTIASLTRTIASNLWDKLSSVDKVDKYILLITFTVGALFMIYLQVFVGI